MNVTFLNNGFHRFMLPGDIQKVCSVVEGREGVLKKQTNRLIFHTANRVLSDKFLDSC